MYYISNDKSELETYNDLVSQSENYDGQFTTKWAEIIEHKDGTQYAILKHDNYHSPLQSVSDLTGWFDDNIL